MSFHTQRSEYMDIKELPGLTPCGTIEHDEYGQLPLYDMDPYVNTPEGWNLLCGASVFFHTL